MSQKKNSNLKIKKVTQAASYGSAKYPYAYTPSSLERLMGEIPKKPRPDKFTGQLLKAWKFLNSNDSRNIAVLKELGLIDLSGAPTQVYADYMQPGTGPAALGKQMRATYDSLFKTVTDITNQEDLKSFFNTFGGGGESVVKLQVQTFKALASHATFGSSDPISAVDTSFSSGTALQTGESHDSRTQSKSSAVIRIDLHIHLPENKTKADYDSILESIAKHIYQNEL